MKSQKPSLQSRIKSLLKSKQLTIHQQPQQKTPQTPTYTIQKFQTIEMSENTLIGKICGGVVVGKNQTTKELLLHLTLVYDHSRMFLISSNKFSAFMRDYQLKADLSIFSYLNCFRDVQLGTFINAWVRRIEKRENNKTFFELHLNRQPQGKYSNIKLGIIKDNVTIPESVLKVYEKQQMLPINFLILYYHNYDNPGLQKQLIKGLKINPIGSLHRISNIQTLRNLNYNFNRIRYIQDISWRDEHLQLGLECIRDGKNQQALQYLKVSQRFDPQYADIYIAKACVHANMNNLSQGLKEIKQALKVDPGNKRALQLYEKFQRQQSDKKNSSMGTNLKKRPTSNNYDIVYKK